MVYPIDKWVLMMIEAGAEIRNLRDVKWTSTEDGSEGPGTGRHIACFILDPYKLTDVLSDDEIEIRKTLLRRIEFLEAKLELQNS